MGEKTIEEIVALDDLDKDINKELGIVDEKNDNANNPEKKDEGKKEPSGLVKHLREQIKLRDQKIQGFEKSPKEDKKSDTTKNSNPMEERLIKLEFENNLAHHYPHLMDDAAKLLEIQKKYPAMPFNEIVDMHLGSALREAKQEADKTNLPPNRPIGMPHIGTGKQIDYSKMSDEELWAQSQKERGQK